MHLLVFASWSCKKLLSFYQKIIYELNEGYQFILKPILRVIQIHEKTRINCFGFNWNQLYLKIAFSAKDVKRTDYQYLSCGFTAIAIDCIKNFSKVNKHFNQPITFGLLIFIWSDVI